MDAVNLLVSRVLILCAVVMLASCATPLPFEKPGFRIARLNIDSHDPSSTLFTANILLEIENRDPEPLPLAGIAADFKVDGKVLFSGVSPIYGSIPGYSIKTVNLSLKSDLMSVLNIISLLKHAGHSVNYQIAIEGRLRNSSVKVYDTMYGSWPN